MDRHIQDGWAFGSNAVLARSLDRLDHARDGTGYHSVMGDEDPARGSVLLYLWAERSWHQHQNAVCGADQFHQQSDERDEMAALECGDNLVFVYASGPLVPQDNGLHCAGGGSKWMQDRDSGCLQCEGAHGVYRCGWNPDVLQRKCEY